MKDVYSIADLRSRTLLDEGAHQPARLAVIGHPVAHSASPQMHQAALDAHGIEARYVRIDIEPGDVAEAFSRMQLLGFIGCNVTIPHKLEAMSACTWVDPNARLLGAVNTIHFEENRSMGYNTDGPGFARAVEEEFGVPLAKLRVAIIGAGGGAGQAIATQSCLLGVQKLVLANRSLGKIQELADRLRGIAPATSFTTLSLDDAHLAASCLDCDLLINTSSVGLKVDDPSILPNACLRPGHYVYDTIYKPAVTPLLAVAQRSGCATANGLSMLIQQGALAFQYWFPRSEPLAAMRKAIRHLATD